MEEKDKPLDTISRGSVLKTRVSFNGSSKIKRVLIVSLDSQNAELCFLFATSQTQQLAYGTSYGRANSILITPEMTTIFEKPTIIDCRLLYSKPRTEIENGLVSGDVTHLGMLPTDLQLRVDDILRNANQFGEQLKRIIVPN